MTNTHVSLRTRLPFAHLSAGSFYRAWPAFRCVQLVVTIAIAARSANISKIGFAPHSYCQGDVCMTCRPVALVPSFTLSFLAILFAPCSAWAVDVVYISVAGDKRVAIYKLDPA